jgi:archaellum biogenesis ATPase FlaH
LASEEQIRDWWERYPDANVGIVTGAISGLLVIDLDTQPSTARLKEIVGVYDWSAVPSSRTGNGWHLFFRHTGVKVASRTNVIPGLDVRGDGGYIVAPPSIHPNGQQYHWEIPIGSDLPVPPPELVRLISRSKIETRGDSSPRLDRIYQGHRNSTLTSLAGTMRRKGMSEEAIRAGLLKQNELMCCPPLSEDEIKAIASSVAKYEPGDPPATLQVLLSHAPEKAEISKSKLIWAKDVPPPGNGEKIDTMLGEFLFPGSLHLLAGEPGIGKTTLLYNLAVHLAKGKDFAGLTVTRPIRILYYDLETPELLFKRKLHLISENQPPEGLAFTRPFSSKEALAHVKEHKFDLIILDTLNEAFETREEEDNAEANRQMQELRKIITETGVAILGVSHMGKDPSSKGIYKLRGASARPAAADVVLNVESYSDDVIRMEVAKSRWIGGKARIFLRKAGEDSFEPTEVSGEETITTENQIKELIAFVTPFEPQIIRTNEIIRQAEEQGFQKSTTEKVLSRMAQIGSHGLKRAKHGVYTKVKTTNSHIDKSFLDDANFLLGQPVERSDLEVSADRAELQSDVSQLSSGP